MFTRFYVCKDDMLHDFIFRIFKAVKKTDDFNTKLRQGSRNCQEFKAGLIATADGDAMKRLAK